MGASAGSFESPKKIVVITAPSGAGKTSIVKKLLTHLPQLQFSVSATTRAKRDNEVHGKDYYFLSVDEFKKKLASDEFVEHEEVYNGQFYGTLKSELERIWGQRKIAVFDIDVKGAAAIKQKYGADVHTVFIKPPSVETLEARLKNRNTESKESLKKRLARSLEELNYESKFDYVVLNKDFDTAYMRVKNSILKYLQH